MLFENDIIFVTHLKYLANYNETSIYIIWESIREKYKSNYSSEAKCQMGHNDSWVIGCMFIFIKFHVFYEQRVPCKSNRGNSQLIASPFKIKYLGLHYP